MPVLKLIVRYAAAACLLIAIAIGLKYFFYTAKKIQPQEIVKQNEPVKTVPDSFNKIIIIKRDTAEVSPKYLAATIVNKKKREKENTIDPYQLMHSFENNYTQLVNLQLNSIRCTPVYAETQGYFSEFKTSLKQMDADEANIRTSIKANGLNEQLLQQLINIYQEKLNVLKSLQQEINKINNRIKQNQLPTDTLTTHFINI